MLAYAQNEPLFSQHLQKKSQKISIPCHALFNSCNVTKEYHCLILKDYEDEGFLYFRSWWLHCPQHACKEDTNYTNAGRFALLLLQKLCPTVRINVRYIFAPSLRMSSQSIHSSVSLGKISLYRRDLRS